MSLIVFNASKEDVALIKKIVDRYEARVRGYRPAPEFDRLSSSMDLEATHCNGCPLRLREFLEAPDFDFVHDFDGIQRHLNRETGKLDGRFLPRFHDSAAAKKGTTT